MAVINFDSTRVDPDLEFKPVPVGEYIVKIIKSDLKDNSKNTGKVLFFEIEVIDGEYTGRRLFDNLNLENPSERAVQIGQARLSQICRAVGVLTPRDSEELHERPLKVQVVIEEARDPTTGQPKDRNKITKYLPALLSVAQSVPEEEEEEVEEEEAPPVSPPPKKKPSVKKVAAAEPPEEVSSRPWEE